MIKKCVFCGHDYSVSRGCVIKKRKYCSYLCKKNYWLKRGNKSGVFLGDKKVRGQEIRRTQSLSTIQKQVSYGTILGDATLSLTRKGSSSLVFEHTEKSLDYVLLKLNILKNLVIQEKPLYRKQRSSSVYKGRVFNSKASYKGKTVTHQDFDEMNNLFYKQRSGKRIKIFPKVFCKTLSVLSVLFWYMDDGCLAPQKYINLHTNNFSKEEHSLIVNTFRKRFGLNVKIYHIKTQGRNFIRINKEDTSALMMLFTEHREYIPQSMEYKFTFF